MKVAIVGAGGHGGVIADALMTRGIDILIGFLDDAPNRVGASAHGFPILGHIESWVDQNVDGFLLGIGDNSLRQQIAVRLLSLGAVLCATRHPATIVSARAIVGNYTNVMAGAVINSSARIGENVIVNTAAVIEHDCVVGAHAHIAPQSCLGGGVEVGEGSLIGIGSTILPGRRIGAWCVVGAGSVVTRDVPAGTVVAGVPARRIS